MFAKRRQNLFFALWRFFSRKKNSSNTRKRNEETLRDGLGGSVVRGDGAGSIYLEIAICELYAHLHSETTYDDNFIIFKTTVNYSQ